MSYKYRFYYYSSKLYQLNDIWQQFCDLDVQQAALPSGSDYTSRLVALKELVKKYQKILLGLLKVPRRTSANIKITTGDQVKRDSAIETVIRHLQRISNELQSSLTLASNRLDWPRFHDLFVELAQYKWYSASQKLHILQSSLRDEARNVLTDTAFPQGGYDDTWLWLKARYQNGRIIRIIGTLKNLDICTKTLNPIIGFLVLRKLDQYALAALKNSSEAPSEIQTLRSVLMFIERHARHDKRTTYRNTSPWVSSQQREL